MEYLISVDEATAGCVREGEPGPRWRSTVGDLQRGNLVVQMRVFIDGGIREQNGAAYTEVVAGRRAELEPTVP